MASLSGDRIELFAASLDQAAVNRQPAAARSAVSDTSGDAQDDSQLVKAARAGDRAAFGRLYDRYARMVHGILLARVPLSEVDDLVQDVFLRALPRLHTLRDPDRFGAWLAAITRNRANDYHRQAVNEVELPEDVPGESAERNASHDSADAAARVSADAEARVLLAAIRELPETYSEILLLRLVEGMTGPEIAERTGLKHGSVRVNLHRGMQQLREKLGQTPHGAAAEKKGRPT
ncbi:MAG TPA: sigma-70 family RNA polymerase sigma factor [Candidatus Angelobacter sp.]